MFFIYVSKIVIKYPTIYIYNRYFHHKSFYYEVKDESDFFYLILCRLM